MVWEVSVLMQVASESSASSFMVAWKSCDDSYNFVAESDYWEAN